MGLTKLKKEINTETSRHKKESEGQAIQDTQRATGDKQKECSQTSTEMQIRDAERNTP